jgi:hypothetical protein
MIVPGFERTGIRREESIAFVMGKATISEEDARARAAAIRRTAA